MDRLSAVGLAGLAALAALAAGCDSKGDGAGAPPPSRTDGAKVSAPNTATAGAMLDAFCDLHATDDKGPAFRWPELAPGGAAPPAPTTWRWVNVWATWCKPCIAEMPRLLAWRDKLAAGGRRFELAFVSVDESDADVRAFRAEHPDTPPSVRVASADKRAAWLKGFGLSDGAIPIHLFVSPANRLRCARAGEIRDKDFALIEKLLAE
ncbi:MAG TPA: TlpA disulfide reductase family protein [Kofleriaceae bacterium]|nr:TlpA disulfide reductase family protein [Kofleriaceae bacterium]